MVRFDRMKLKDGKDKYHFENWNSFTNSEDLDAEVKINTVWETIRDNIKISAKERLGYYELRKHKPRVDEGCSKLLDQRKQGMLQWLQD
jgi:hypothetical protein